MEEEINLTEGGIVQKLNKEELIDYIVNKIDAILARARMLELSPQLR